MKKISVSLLSTMLLSTAALADGSVSERDTMPAASNALELTIGMLFSQSHGDLGGDLPAIEDVAGPGAGFEGSIGWRITPNLLLGGYANVSGFSDTDDSNKGAGSFTAGIKADWHFKPTASVDPWISLGTGVKVLGIEDGDNDRALTGLELAKVQVGVDYRFSKSFAIAPVIGASASVFNHQYDDNDDAMRIRDREIHWTFSAGLLGRFDTLGSN